MNPLRYKLMISYLPGMASIVNSFQSPDVQKVVFDSLMEALDAKMEAESSGAGMIATAKVRATVSTPRLHAGTSSSKAGDSDVLMPSAELAHDLAEGDSIHSMGERQEALP